MVAIEEAEAYARSKNADIAFCNGVLFRLKSVGVIDETVLCAAFLCNANSSFDEIHARFGREIAVLVASLSKDKNLPKQLQGTQYTKQLQEAPWEAVLIKLCEISANLKVIKESSLTKTKRGKLLKQNIHHLNVLKDKIAENKPKTPGIDRLLEGVNETLTHFGQRPIKF
ncbi:MAG: bifunctional (p)ppGpp synthetase/guanosine-3',5'-bis(diphosphate) 3'-pyrophosphohydrolase [Candidatus Nitrosotenuis sp.]